MSSRVPKRNAPLAEEGGVNESSSGVHGQQMSPLRSPENDRSGRSSASTSPPAASSSFRIGSRVEIIGRDHPWFGGVGHIYGPFNSLGLQWSVELENGQYPGHRVAVSEFEIRSRPRGI